MRKALTFLTASLVLTWVAPVMAQSAPDQFKDVEPNHWAYQAMESLRAKGIVVGYPDGYFRGRRTLTRYEFAVALDRALNKIQLTPGPAGAAGEPGAAGPAGEAGPAGKDYDPAELDALKKLTGEFKDELASLGNTVNAVNAKLDALGKDVAALKEAWDKAPKISGQAFFGIRADRAAGDYVDHNGAIFSNGRGTPIFRDPTVVHEFQLGVDAKITGGATISAKLNASNYLPTLGENFAQQNDNSFVPNKFEKNAGEDIWLDQLEIKAPFGAVGREGAISIGRFSVQGSKYMLWRPDTDVYFDNPIEDDGMYRVDGLKATTKFGSLGIEVFGAQTKSVQTTDWEGGLNSPLAGTPANNGPMQVDQMVGLSGKLPIRAMDGGYFRLSALGLSNNTTSFNPDLKPAVNGGQYTTVLVLGADGLVKLSDRLGVTVDWAKSISGEGSFRTIPGGAERNNAVEGKVSYDAGKLKLAAGYKYIDPRFYTPGYWDRIGPWLNPTNVQGPTFGVDYAFGDNLAVKVGGELLTGARNDDFSDMTPKDELNKIDAGVRYNLSKAFRATLDWEGIFAKVDDGDGDITHPTLQYVTIGTGYNLTSNTVLKLAYEIGDFNGHGLSFINGGPDHYNYNTFTTQVAVKF